MDNNFIINNYTSFVRSTPITGPQTATSSQSSTDSGVSFKDVLQKEMQSSSSNLVFSKHALQRIDNREIKISTGLLNDVSDAVTRANEKGIKDALILGEGTAFIVNVPSRTVITTMGSQDMNQNVITNIDGTVII